MKELTEYGYEAIIGRVKNRIVEPPKNLTIEQLNEWLTGYATCQNDILDIIESLSKSQREM